MPELVDVLDDISLGSSKTVQLAALKHLQALLADVCIRSNDPAQRTRFLTLQNDFETNIASRILSSGIISASAALRAVEELRSKSSSSTIANAILLALSVLQGMALIHPRSKAHMGRKSGIQTLLDLLTALRHASANPDDPDASVLPGIDAPDAKLASALSPLACSVIDTLLCLLVDSPVALRVFEECNGLEVIVRTLKKVIGQSVRMKCLEFLYFYLQDEEVLAITSSNPKSPPSRSRAGSKSSRALDANPETPRRPKPQQTPATDVRPRTRATPLERTVSGSSTVSIASTRSDAESRSVSRASSRSAASHVNEEPERRFPRTSVMPSLSYSSSTVSSSSTANAYAQPSTPAETRPSSPSVNQECLVPLPESPVKPGAMDTPKPKRRTRTEETPVSKLRDREREKGHDTPRAKVRSRDQPNGNGNLFPSSGTSTPPSSNPFAKPSDVFSSKPTPTLNLSLLKGDVDYEPESPKKRKPSRNIDDELRKQAETPTKESSNPFSTPETKPAKHRPRQSEILPRPAVIRPGPRIVSTPPCTTPTTPIGTGPSTPTEVQPVRTPEPASVETPGRKKKAAIPGGARVPGAAREGSSDLRKSVMGAVAKAQPSSEALRRSQASTEALRKSPSSRDVKSPPRGGDLKSPASSADLRRSNNEGLKKSQVGQEAKRQEPLRKSQASSPDLRRDKEREESRLKSKKSVPSTPISAVKARIRVDGGRSSGEFERRSLESEKRISFDEPAAASSPAREGDKKLVRSSAEKKELLGAWLGNVDALVEGVQRAGVWGLRS